MTFSRIVKWIVLCAACACLAAGGALFCARAYFPKKFSGQITACSHRYGLEESLVYAIIKAESNFRPDAVSAAGAVGLMQVMPSTARFLAEISGKSMPDLTDAESNIETGCAYLGYLFGKFGGVEEVLAAYNAGEGRVRRWLLDARYSADGESLSCIPIGETREYVNKVKKFWKCYKTLYF